MALTFYLVLLLAGGNDIIATNFHLSINDITELLRRGADLRRPADRLLGHQADLPRACSAATATWCCTAARPAASCGPPTASSSRCTSRSTSTSAGPWSSTSRRSRCEIGSRPRTPTASPPARPVGAAPRPGCRTSTSRTASSPVTPAELAAAHHHGEHEAIEAPADRPASLEGPPETQGLGRPALGARVGQARTGEGPLSPHHTLGLLGAGTHRGGCPGPESRVVSRQPVTEGLQEPR